MRVYLVNERELIAESDEAAERLWPGAWAFVRDAEPQPREMLPPVTMRQARLALLAAGKDGEVEALIAGLPEPLKTRAGIEWTFAGEVRRDGPLLLELQPMLGWTDDELDALFVAAYRIQ